jgi:hypothetical protein
MKIRKREHRDTGDRSLSKPEALPLRRHGRRTEQGCDFESARTAVGNDGDLLPGFVDRSQVIAIWMWAHTAIGEDPQHRVSDAFVKAPEGLSAGEPSPPRRRGGG